jgi:sulfonate transport system substrate-binding protein
MLNPLRALTLGGLLLSALGHAAPAAPDALRIGYQKGSVSMVLAKSHQLLEQRYPKPISRGLNSRPVRRCWRR